LERGRVKNLTLLLGRHVAALADARALLDPLVAGLHAELLDEVVVGDHPRRDVEAGSRDVGVGHFERL